MSKKHISNILFVILLFTCFFGAAKLLNMFFVIAKYNRSHNYNSQQFNPPEGEGVEKNLRIVELEKFTEISSGISYAKPKTTSYIVQNGDTIESILSELEIEKNFARKFIASFKKSQKQALKIYPGQELIFEIASYGYDENIKKIENNIFGPPKPVDDKYQIISFSTKIEGDKYLFVKLQEQDFTFSTNEIESTKKITTISGQINNSLFADGIKLDMPIEIVMSLIDMYSFEVDFQRDIRQGDNFVVSFEDFYDAEGKRLKSGRILFSHLYLERKNVLQYFYYEQYKDYFDLQGESFKKGLMKTPINGARLSSNFGYRKHPILGYTKLHKGVDFAAPRGTPILAAGDGVIGFIGRKGGYGNYIKIRHNANYSTAYAHMSGFAKRSKRGKRIKQGEIIGYVGTSGRSTGNHLHYEIIKDGVQINPKSVKFKSAKNLTKSQKADFLQQLAAFKFRNKITTNL